MGQSKYNSTAIAAKNGDLLPKAKPLSKRESEDLLWRKICFECMKRFDLPLSLRDCKY